MNAFYGIKPDALNLKNLYWTRRIGKPMPKQERVPIAEPYVNVVLWLCKNQGHFWFYMFHFVVCVGRWQNSAQKLNINVAQLWCRGLDLSSLPPKGPFPEQSSSRTFSLPPSGVSDGNIHLFPTAISAALTLNGLFQKTYQTSVINMECIMDLRRRGNQWWSHFLSICLFILFI